MGVSAFITGGSGQVGQAVQSVLSRMHITVVAPERSGFPLDRPEALSRELDKWNPTLILHLGAFTAVDRAETESSLAFKINSEATRVIATWCGRHDRPVLYMSTDFVFDGTPPPARSRARWLQDGYETIDPPHPLNVYGASKLAGEEAVRCYASKYWILRTSWVFGAQRASFPDAILRQAAAGHPIRVVTDQVGRPTYAPDLAHAALRLMGLKGPGGTPAPWGTYHSANCGVASWYEVAVETLRRAGWTTSVHAVTSEEHRTPAIRPARSVLSVRSTMSLGIHLPPWQSGIKRFVAAAGETNPELLATMEGDCT